MQEIKLYKSKWKNFGLLVASFLFVFGGLYFIIDKTADTFKLIIGWASILFFGLGIPISLFNLLDWRPQIIINNVGIYDRTILKEFINWNIIENAYLVDTGVKFICITLNADIDIKNFQSKFSRKVSSINKKMGFQELNGIIPRTSVFHEIGHSLGYDDQYIGCTIWFETEQIQY